MKEVMYHTDEMAWQEAKGYPAGAKLKVLREGGPSAGRTVLLKLPPDWEMEAHSHTTVEQHYVLEGENESQGKIFTAGSYQLIPRKTDHGPFVTKSGAVILVVWDSVGT